MSWRLRAQIEEVWRNLRFLNLVLVLFAAALLGVVGLAERAEVTAILEREHALERAGLHVYVAESSAGGVDTRRCTQLARTTGVLAAGAVTPQSRPLMLATDPGGELPVLAVTPGLVSVWDPDHQGSVAAFGVTQSAAEDLGLLAGASALPRHPGRAADARTTSGPVTVDFVADVAVRAAHVGNAAFVVVPPTGPSSQCWVEFAPDAAIPSVQVVRAALGTPGADLAVRPLAVRDEALVRPLPQALGARATRRAWLAVGLSLGLVGAAVAWGRRHDLAVYRALGMGRLSTLAYQAMETLVVVTIGTSLAVAVVAVASGGAVADGTLPSLLALRSVLRAACLWWAASILAGLPFALPNRMMATLKSG